MKEFTKKLYEEREEDLAKLRYRNNSKDEKRTAEQIRQSAKDQAKRYTDKWNRLLEQCETPAQKGICEDVLHRISIHFNHGEVVADVKEKYGKNSIFKAMDLEDGATAIERNGQIGGHKA